MSRLTKIAAAALGTVALVGGLSACSTGASEDTIKLGVVGEEAYWDTLADEAKAEGLNVEIVSFTDYNQPNPAVSEGELDINGFQHIIYLSQYNADSGDTLVPIGATATYPLGLYSQKHDSLESIPAGGSVAVPNDATNRARGLLVLQDAGLVSLKDGGSTLSTLEDVLPESKVTVTELAADITASSLPDLDAAIINNDFVADAGLTAEDALYSDDPASADRRPYVNILVTTQENAENADYLKLVEIFQNSDAVKQGLLDASGGTAVFPNTPAAELQTTLDELVAEIKAKG